MVLCGTLALTNILFNRVRRLSGWALFWLAWAVAGSQLGVSRTGHGWLPTPGQMPAHVPYLGVDWFIFDLMATSRTHGIETVLSTVVILAPAFLLGFSQSVINVYILIAGVQAVFNHANASVRLGPLRYLIVTPNFHHWHHSRDAEALDRCYAAHFPIWDYLFGTAPESGVR